MSPARTAYVRASSVLRPRPEPDEQSARNPPPNRMPLTAAHTLHFLHGLSSAGECVQGVVHHLTVTCCTSPSLDGVQIRFPREVKCNPGFSPCQCTRIFLPLLRALPSCSPVAKTIRKAPRRPAPDKTTQLQDAGKRPMSAHYFGKSEWGAAAAETSSRREKGSGFSGLWLDDDPPTLYYWVYEGDRVLEHERAGPSGRQGASGRRGDHESAHRHRHVLCRAAKEREGEGRPNEVIRHAEFTAKSCPAGHGHESRTNVS